MSDPASQQRNIEMLLRYSLQKGTKTKADVEAMAFEALARQVDGTDTVEVTFEGGSTRAQLTTPPDVLGAACMTVLAEIDETNPLAGATLANRYADFSGGNIET